MNNVLYLVVPCYNEEEVLPSTAGILRDKLREMVSAKLISEKAEYFL